MDIVNEILKNNIEESIQTTSVEKLVEVDKDLGSLMVSDYNQFDVENIKKDKEAYLLSLTRDNTQLLFNDVFALETERRDDAFVAKLPKPTFLLPRARSVPKPKPLTKWQQFAKEKGIKTKKKGRSKLKWDEELNKWIPTFGYKKVAAETQKDWLVEVGADNTPKADPREAKSSAKQERIAKNELQRLRNLAKAKNIKVPRVGLPTTEQFASAKHLATAKTVARVSTASVGKFQDRLPKEKDAKDIAKEVPGMKRKKKSCPLNMADEKHRNTEWVNDVILKKKKTILNSEAITPAPADPAPVPKGRKHLGKSSAKKPKAGKGKRDPHTKVGGRKRRL
ncbi:hypothetical protein HCN44_006868 [Aphidius gifuensis]|uniref:Ribosome biogenesis regulatory protein n=1 Tax=Aphidius gifuensis TaxID=684658 RepID=A0A834Y3D2_APHGI|nr:ribosome biogenesis regulatory protein homolog [Aphidius gifuensis]KAF7995761.1 hypothetical protein HCN44_006868 [Aphidius gifuensis]